MQILALETSGDACSCALLNGANAHARTERVPRGHTRRLLPMVGELLDTNGVAVAALDAIAFGRGPGSFTGVRIATSLAQGLGLASGVPLMGVSTLAALAAAAWRVHGWSRVIACLDARMQEVYLGAYLRDAAGQWRNEGEEQVAAAQVASLPGDGAWYVVGAGFGAYCETFEGRLGNALAGSAPELEPTALDVAELARSAMRRGEQPVPPAAAAPVYLRDRVAQPPRAP